MRRSILNFKRLLVQLLFIGLVLTLNRVSWAEPKIKFNETEFNFGRVCQGKSQTHIFEFQNIGNETLVIKDVKAG